MISQYYDLKKEELGMFIKDILTDWIIPEFGKQMKSKHSIMLGEFEGEELDKIRNLILVNKTNKSILNYITKNRKIPSTSEYELFQTIEGERIKKSKEIEIPKDFYKDLKYKIDIIITNEQIDVASRLTTLQTILQIIGGNPTIIQDPKTKKIFYKLIDLAGFSPVDMGLDEPESMQNMMMNQMAQRGGSVARSATPSTAPTNMSSPQRL
jgi:hypothetical protein